MAMTGARRTPGLSQRFGAVDALDGLDLGFPREEALTCLGPSGAGKTTTVRLLMGLLHPANPAILLSDCGTIDELAEQGPVKNLWVSIGLPGDVRRYDTGVRQRTPAAEPGYNQQNPLRTDSPRTAGVIDGRILDAGEHPRRYLIDPAGKYLDKPTRAPEILQVEPPPYSALNLNRTEPGLGTGSP